MKDIYRAHTGDLAAHQRAIDARYRKLDPRRRRILELRLAGQSWHEIAAAERISRGSAHDIVDRAMESIRKGIAGEPRFNKLGKGHRQQIEV